MIVRYTTPSVLIDMDTDMEAYDDVRVTFKQGKGKITKKPTISGARLTVGLTQDETGKFDTYNPINVQVNAWKNGKRYASAWMTSDTLDNLLDEVIE